MKNNSFLAILTISMLAFSACGKDDSPKDLLTGASCWKQVKVESRASANDTWIDDSLSSCSKDDCTSFTSDGKFSFDEGATKCDPGDPQTSSGTFSLTEDGKTLVMTDNQLSLPFTVEELTANKLVLTFALFGEIRTTYEAQ